MDFSNDDFLVFTTILPKAENEPYKGDFGDEGPLDQPHDTQWYVDRFLEDEQGNGVIVWASLCSPEKRPKIMKDWNGGEPLVKLFRDLADKGVKIVTVYSQGHHGDVYLSEKVVKELAANDAYIGECVGEFMNGWFRTSGRYKKPNGGKFKNLREVKDHFVNEFIAGKVKKIRDMGYPRTLTASIHAVANYELEGGVDIPVNESLRSSYNLSEARGACRKFGKKVWGLYLYHDWYTRDIPFDAPRKFDLLRSALYLAWMNGASLVALESGNLWTESGFYTKGSDKNHPYESPVCQKYRETIRDFHRFAKRTPKPAGGPLVRTCFALGHLDGFSGNRHWLGDENCCSGLFKDDFPTVWGLGEMAKTDSRYVYGAPEFGWAAFFDTVSPTPSDALAPYGNLHLSGTPFGAADVVAVDAKTPDDVLAAYKTLVYAGWNTMEPAIYDKLLKYVENGGSLLMCLPHLSTRDDREYWNYAAADLINAGDLSELFGVKVKGKGKYIYQGHDEGKWAKDVFPYYDFDVESASGEAMFTIPNFKVETILADLEVGPDAEVLFTEETRTQFKRGDSAGHPLFVRKKLGSGEAYLITSWEYPGAAGVKKLYRYILKNLLYMGRDPDAFIAEKGTSAPGETCRRVHFAVYPNAVYLLNIDHARPIEVDLWLDGKKRAVAFAPGEFKIVERRER